WPGTSIPITDDPAVTTAEWSGLIAPPTPAHVAMIHQQLMSAEEIWHFKPVLEIVLDALRKNALEPKNLSASIVDVLHQLDWSLGLKHHAVLVSPMLASQPYLAFVHHVLSRATAFAADYNGALAEYRTQAGITSNMRPMPDLAMNADSVEVPFWLDHLV